MGHGAYLSGNWGSKCLNEFPDVTESLASLHILWAALPLFKPQRQFESRWQHLCGLCSWSGLLGLTCTSPLPTFGCSLMVHSLPSVTFAVNHS